MTTYRPVGARIVAYGVAVLGIVVTVAIAVALPEFVVWTPAQLVTLSAIGLGILVALHGIGRSFVRADDDGLTIVNGYRRHRLAWTEIEAIAMKRGAPWPTAILHSPLRDASVAAGGAPSDDERHVILFAIQGSDGEVARKAAADLAQRVRRGVP